MFQSQTDIAGNDRENVVEVMCNTARQPADALELLGLAQAFFSTFALRYVARYCDCPDNSAGLIAHRNRAGFDGPLPGRLLDIDEYFALKRPRRYVRTEAAA